MRFDKTIGAAMALSVAVFGAGTLISYYLLGLLFAFLLSPGPGMDAEIIEPMVLLIASLLIGVMFAFLSFRHIVTLLKENGLPGVIPPPDVVTGKSIRVGLTIVGQEEENVVSERFSIWIPAHHIFDFMRAPETSKIVLANSAGLKLALKRTVNNENEGGDRTILVKLISGRKALISMEMAPQSRGSFEVDYESGKASCTYRLSYVGCEDHSAGGWLTFFGDKRVMRAVFLKAA